jgi:hypothetical protein
MKPPVESFVVRVYRYPGGKSRQLVGVVQAPRFAGSRAFTSVAQLWEILAERAPAMRKKRPGTEPDIRPARGPAAQLDPSQESEE